jgi:hypothetical protein
MRPGLNGKVGVRKPAQPARGQSAICPRAFFGTFSGHGMHIRFIEAAILGKKHVCVQRMKRMGLGAGELH